MRDPGGTPTVRVRFRSPAHLHRSLEQSSPWAYRPRLRFVACPNCKTFVPAANKGERVRVWKFRERIVGTGSVPVRHVHGHGCAMRMGRARGTLTF